MSLWPFSSRSHGNDWTPIAGDTPEEVGQNFAATVDTSGMSETEKLQAMQEHAQQWSDEPREQGEYLFGLLRGLGL
jgi:hypothetical protein